MPRELSWLYRGLIVMAVTQQNAAASSPRYTASGPILALTSEIFYECGVHFRVGRHYDRINMAGGT